MDPLDYLKYAAAAANDQLGCVLDLIDQADDEHPLTPDNIDYIRGLVDRVRNKVVDAAAVFCRDGRDLDTYSDGRPVRTRVELEAGNYADQLWHPQPNHPINQPGEGCTVETSSGRRRTVVISAPGVLDVVDAEADQ